MSQPSPARKTNETIGQWYARKYLSDVSETTRLLDLLNSTPIPSIEKHFADLHSQNDIINEIKTYQKRAKELNEFANSAKQNRHYIKNENDCDRAAMSAVRTLLQQEKDFERASQLYRDFCCQDFKYDSEIYLTDQMGQPALSNIKFLEESISGFENLIKTRSTEIQNIDELIHSADEKSKISESNSNVILKFAKESKRLEGFGEEEQHKQQKTDNKSDNKSDLLRRFKESQSVRSND